MAEAKVATPDSTGRYILDHVVDIPSNTPELRVQTTRMFHLLRKRGYVFSEWSVDAAIRSHNHPLLRWLMERAHVECWPTPVRQLNDDQLTWTAVNSRNRAALRYAVLQSEHFETVALDNDTRFLGAMLSVQPMDQPINRISIDAFHHMLNDETEVGDVGFLWLLRHNLIDLDTITLYHREQILRRYGGKARYFLDTPAHNQSSYSAQPQPQPLHRSFESQSKIPGNWSCMAANMLSL